MFITDSTPGYKQSTLWRLHRLQIAKPLQRHLALSIATCIILFIAFLLYLLVTLSVPIIRTIYLVDLKASILPGQPVTSIATEITFGVWGYCAIGALNTECSQPKLGYSFSQQILSDTGYQSVATIIVQALTVVLVLHPVVAGLSFVGMISSLWLASHSVLIFSLIVTIINTVLSTVVFAIDLAINIVARDEAALLTQFSLSFRWGNAVWMSLAGVILSWVGMILLSIPVCGCCGVRERYHKWETAQAEKAKTWNKTG